MMQMIPKTLSAFRELYLLTPSLEALLLDFAGG